MPVERRSVGAMLVDDEADVRLLVRLLIEAHNEGLYVSGEADSGHAAIEQVSVQDPEVIVLDQRMSGLDGLETAARILEVRPAQRIVLFSAFVDPQLEADARASGITACLPKRQVSDLPALLLDISNR